MHYSLGIARLPAAVAHFHFDLFKQRKNGLFKKAYELGVLCSVDVAVIIFGTSLLSTDDNKQCDRPWAHTRDAH